jgi:transcriptional regulator with XRE-family HTH domain
MKPGEKIRYLRLKNNLTSRELSKALNISESSISLYENGKRKPSIELIIKVADYFNVTTDFLLGVSDNYLTNPEKDSKADFSEVLENIITLLNNQNYIIFDGKDVDDKTVIIFKNNLNFVLENMRMITEKTT